MPGWPLWCGVGLAKSSFMEGGGRLKPSIHPAGIMETTKQPKWSQIQRPALLKTRKTEAVASAQKCAEQTEPPLWAWGDLNVSALYNSLRKPERCSQVLLLPPPEIGKASS